MTLEQIEAMKNAATRLEMFVIVTFVLTVAIFFVLYHLVMKNKMKTIVAPIFVAVFGVSVIFTAVNSIVKYKDEADKAEKLYAIENDYQFYVDGQKIEAENIDFDSCEIEYDHENETALLKKK